MKLVNPAGRTVLTFDTQANSCQCICSDIGDQAGASTGANVDGTCACQCSYGPTNSNANETGAGY